MRIQEANLLDICELLEADTMQVEGTAVTFTKVLPHDRQTWSAEFGDWVVPDGRSWKIQGHPGPTGTRTGTAAAT
ncbi:MAG TPA: hypothetical protein VFP89_11995 [Propionibacteriaceae bacterium]|nr:hypothetical protein [Propionibacteriaceae bacterium]